MAIGQTHSEITTNPSKMAVTTATERGNQQTDVERKLKLYGIIQALGDGRMPDNTQINQALDFAINHSPVSLNKLSPDGKLLVEDVRDILETARMMIMDKNDGELFQNFIWSTRNGDPSRGKKSKSELLPVSKDDATADAKQAAAHLRTLLTLFATNSEARKLLSDLGLISRDLFATAAERAANKARPDQDQLDQVDKPAPSGEWIGADGQRVGKDETPELQLKGPRGTEFRMNPKDDPANAKTVDHHGNERAAGDAYNEASNRAGEAKEQARAQKEDAKGAAQDQYQSQGGAGGLKEQARSHANDVAHSSNPLEAARYKKEEAKNQARGTADRNTDYDNRGEAKQDAKNKALNAVPDDVRNKASQGIDKTKDFLNENFPEERRDQFIYRLKKVVVECQDHKDYQEAITFFLDQAENYKGAAKHVAAHGGDSAAKVASDPAYETASLQFRALLERFANNQSMQPLMDSVDAMYSDSANDSELRDWYHRLNDYIHRVLLEPGYILDDDSTREGRQIRHDGKRFFDHKYKGHFDNFSNQIQSFFTAMGDDPLNARFGEDWKRLVKDLLFNSEGNLEFKPRLWNDIRQVILPSLIQQIGYVPIPRAEYSDDKIDLVVENLVLQGANLWPNIIEVDVHNHFGFSPYDRINKMQDSNYHRIRLTMSQIQADLRDVQFAFRRKSGWPKIKDSGLADVVIGGKGIGIIVDLETVANRRDSVFRVKDIDVDIDTLKFSIRNSHHDLLYKFVKATATGIIKHAIEAAIHTALRTALEGLDDQLAEVRNKMDDAKKSDEASRTQTLKELFAKKKDRTKHAAQKADEKTGTFKLVTSPDDSVVRDLDERQAKESWTKRAFKVEEAAHSGDSWRSPVFGLFDKQHPAVTGSHHPQATGAVGQAAHAATGAASSHRL
ncbi:hypothetical protein QFC24_002393 [Naganishia onofrii]|uniref:Uncharacterized protein n=1 Tax=Naganishia onofrii TaxID=1851511 RepID=A0ACC2XRX6_9TREE|nr:hypothetical protein QFC24_002393 [Naganishia onofrii]